MVVVGIIVIVTRCCSMRTVRVIVVRVVIVRMISLIIRGVTVSRVIPIIGTVIRMGCLLLVSTNSI